MLTVRRFGMLALGLLATVLPAIAAVTESLHILTPDGPRDYVLVRPDAAPAPGATARPLVLLLHGHGGSAVNAVGQGLRPSPLSAWRAIVDREGVVLAVLQGATGGDGKPGWNDCRRTARGNPNTDDVGFARAVIQDVAQRLPIDRRRTYAMGMSNGAMMAQRLALELEPALAAFAAVSGSLAADSVCRLPAHRVSALLIFGTDDPVVPYAGGEVKVVGRPRGRVMPVVDNLGFWLHANGLDRAPERTTETPLAHRAAQADPTSAYQTVFGASPEQTQVSLVRVVGGGHIEPSLLYHYGALYEGLVGKQNRDFESAELAWQFFKNKTADAGPH